MIKQVSVVVVWRIGCHLLIRCCPMTVSTELLVTVSGAAVSATHKSLVRFPAESLSSHTWQRIKPLCLLKYAGSPLSWRDSMGLQHLQLCSAPGQQIGSWQQPQVASPNTA